MSACKISNIWDVWVMQIGKGSFIFLAKWQGSQTWVLLLLYGIKGNWVELDLWITLEMCPSISCHSWERFSIYEIVLQVVGKVEEVLQATRGVQPTELGATNLQS